VTAVAPGPSRWSTVHPHVTPAADGLLPGGFRAAGVPAGIKPQGLDLGLIVSVEPATTSAARFTASSVVAAPVQLCRTRTRLDAIRTIVANSGNANAATGNVGFEQAAKVQGAAGLVGGVREDQVAVASTGVIGVQLDGQVLIRGLTRANDELRRDGAEDFAAAIRTTDAFAKQACVDVALSGGTVRLTAQAKGAGMIQPGFATMLCFIQTDAVLAPETADLLLGVCVKRSFERISVDGQLSTNDTVILQCSGAAEVTVAPESPDELRFGEALDAVLRDLALLIVRDGEGAGRIGRVVVRGGDAEQAERAARAVANSPLVKTALHGGDPNWGRIAQAVGAVIPSPTHPSPLALDIAIEGVPVCRGGAAGRFDLAELERAVARDEVEYEVTLPGAGAETEVFFSDLGHGYVTINAEYTT
jgi:glutamate N-acetyltransferase / amino-acid N-acetyltransferase